MPIERNEIGKGWEHRVTKKSVSKYVVKEPRLLSKMYVFLNPNKISLLRQEITAMQSNPPLPDLIVPKTRVKQFGRTYRIVQKSVEEDNTVNKDDYFKEKNNEDMYVYYRLHPENFVGSNNQVYWIDPTNGFITRLLDQLHIIRPAHYRKFKYLLKEIVTRRLQ